MLLLHSAHEFQETFHLRQVDPTQLNRFAEHETEPFCVELDAIGGPEQVAEAAQLVQFLVGELVDERGPYRREIEPHVPEELGVPTRHLVHMVLKNRRNVAEDILEGVVKLCRR